MAESIGRCVISSKARPEAPHSGRVRVRLSGRTGSFYALPIVAMSSGRLFLNGIAVGMTIVDHPPRRSVLAELPHTAPPLDSSVETNVGIGMKSTWTRNPSIKDRPQLFPIGLPPLTATT